MLRALTVLFVCLLAKAAICQGSAEDYRRATDLLAKWLNLGVAFNPDIHWASDGLWYANGRGDQREFVRVTRDGRVRRGRDAKILGIAEKPNRLMPRNNWSESYSSRQASTLTFENRLKRKVRLFRADGRGKMHASGEIAPGKKLTQATFAGHKWVADYSKDDLVGVFVAEAGKCQAVFDEHSRRTARRGKRPDDASKRMVIRDHDVWLRQEGAKRLRLTTDGTAEDGYRVPGHVSPNQDRAFGFRVRSAEEHLVHRIESSPPDQLQPKLLSRNYLKPGDRIERPLPALFDLKNGKHIPVDASKFDDAWAINHVHWSADSSEVYCVFNQRGHQLLRLYAIDASSGKVRTVIDERSDTFIDYSQKTWLHWLEGDELLWASERDGWNHIYHVNAKTGAMRQITKGNWLVRKVERVDGKRIWFTAFGLHSDQDPYHAHLARIDFDGNNLTPLTQSDGYHKWQLSPDRALLLARWSRVDHPWVTELRNAETGKLIVELGRDDRSALLAAGFLPPERFVAKGRDGKTDIHGILIKPSNFDPTRRYPVIEDIYAGPHSHFVPKRWGLGSRQRKVAELGFVVVRIDGMGTNWRSRAFHDVCWRNLKDSGFPDRIAWMREAAVTRKYMDLERVGIFGGSAGGQSTLAALLHFGDFYDVGVSDCGCHDNRMDKTWWNEAWLGWPVGPWYADNSNVTHAGKLRGQLLLTVGELDTNVDPASTMQVVDALIRADKDFDLVVVPGGKHGVGERPYLVRRRQDFFVRHLLGVNPRHYE
ncbi:MAG: dipeptidyl-peptidase-4 [Planctomycetota bacterium]|jgi:dipeptidyl-peptidase-4